MRRFASTAVALLACGALASRRGHAQAAGGELRNVQGEVVGTFALVQEPAGVKLTVEASNLPPGFHGLHVHAVGRCEAPFASAGGHLAAAGQDHAHHAGDLPDLLVNPDRRAFIAVTTARFRLQDLSDADGSAIIIHADPDNHANIPARYRPAADPGTLATGDAGGRIACGVIGR